MGHGLLGAGGTPTGLSEPHLRAAHLGTGAHRIPLGGLDRESYLMAAGLLKAFEDGISHKLDPGEPEERTSMPRSPPQESEEAPHVAREALAELDRTRRSSGAAG